MIRLTLVRLTFSLGEDGELEDEKQAEVRSKSSCVDGFPFPSSLDANSPSAFDPQRN